MSQPSLAQRRMRTGWSEQENQLLWDAVRIAEQSSRPLKEVFSEVATATGRQPNSIRNYYYTVAKARGEGGWRTLSFTPFEEHETRKLVKDILAAVSQGESVRSCVQRMGGQSRTLMLRYQNKYRAVLKSRPELVSELLEELHSEGVSAINPYDRMENRKRRQEVTPIHEDEDAYAVSFSPLGPEAAPMIRGIKRCVAKYAEQSNALKTLLEENDRLKVQVDILRLELAKRDEAIDRIQSAKKDRHKG